MTDTLAIVAAVAAVVALAVYAARLRYAAAKSRAEMISSNSRLEAELEKARDERNGLLDALSDAFLLVDDQAGIRFANRAARFLFVGRELTGRPVQEVFLDSRLSAPLLQCLATGEPVQSRIVLPQEASPRGNAEGRGMNAWVIDAAPLPSPRAGDPTTRVIIRDVTAEHQAERIRQDFVANASHELRTPLAIINGYLENLLDDGIYKEPETACRFLNIMRRHADRVSSLVEDMLTISRLESGEVGALKIETFPLLSCINDVLERLESVTRSQKAEIAVVLPDPAVQVRGDPSYWKQVLFNLLENALKQNPQQALRIEVGGEVVDGRLHVWVGDNGIGIPSAHLPHIFRRFYRVEKHHSQQEIKGTGLGLSIVKRAVEAHHGDISVTSIPGKETKFLISVPAAPADPIVGIIADDGGDPR